MGPQGGVWAGRRASQTELTNAMSEQGRQALEGRALTRVWGPDRVWLIMGLGSSQGRQKCRTQCSGPETMGRSPPADPLHRHQEHVLFGNKKEGTWDALSPWMALGACAGKASPQRVYTV